MSVGILLWWQLAQHNASQLMVAHCSPWHFMLYLQSVPVRTQLLSKRIHIQRELDALGFHSATYYSASPVQDDNWFAAAHQYYSIWWCWQWESIFFFWFYPWKNEDVILLFSHICPLWFSQFDPCCMWTLLDHGSTLIATCVQKQANWLVSGRATKSGLHYIDHSHFFFPKTVWSSTILSGSSALSSLLLSSLLLVFATTLW